MGVHKGRAKPEEGLILPRELHCCINNATHVMSTPRKELVWSIKKNLFKLSSVEIYRLAKEVATNSGSSNDLEPTDEESCVDYILNYMKSETLLSAEDEGMSQLLVLNDLVCSILCNSDICDVEKGVIKEHEVLTYETATPPHATRHCTSAPIATDHATQQQAIPSTAAATQSVDQLQVMYEELGKKLQHFKETAYTTHNSQRNYSEPTHQFQYHAPQSVGTEKVVSLKDLSYLQRREFKVQGGQIGEQNSDITYSNICKQIDEGTREGFTETEIIRGVLRIIKPGAFKDMLSHKDEITIDELKGFLRSHLGEKAGTELFQELMCAKQNDQESPQQFLYRMIGLKQKILFQSRQANTDIRYDHKTIQEVFLHTIYQGLGSKHTDIRQQLRPLLSNNRVMDEEIVSHVTKIVSDENEHLRRIGYGPRQKATHIHSVGADGIYQSVKEKDHQAIQQLSAQVETLTNLVTALMDQQSAVAQTVRPKASPGYTQRQHQTHDLHAPISSRIPPSIPGQPSLTRKGKPPRCTNCSQQGSENCNHCFVCGDPGHLAVGCLKKVREQGNGSRLLLRDNQGPNCNSSPTQ